MWEYFPRSGITIVFVLSAVLRALKALQCDTVSLTYLLFSFFAGKLLGTCKPSVGPVFYSAGTLKDPRGREIAFPAWAQLFLSFVILLK
jgi:hypothetical protein